MKIPNVAIDGSAGSGKSTVATALASQLGLVYLDTGLMYRGVALECLRKGVVASDAAAVTALLPELNLEVVVEGSPQPACRVLLDGEDVTDFLHDPRVTALVSQVAAISPVRRDLVRRQQLFATRGGVIMVGRDIASVVLPEAEVKVFLEADLDERARRRTLELNHDGRPAEVSQVQAQLDDRDRQDSERADSPLLCVADAVRVDTTHLTIEQVVQAVSEIVRSRGGL